MAAGKRKPRPRRTSRIQHRTSNIQRGEEKTRKEKLDADSHSPLSLSYFSSPVRCWMFDVECSMLNFRCSPWPWFPLPPGPIIHTHVLRPPQPAPSPQQSLAARPVRLVDARSTSTDAGGGRKLRVPLRPLRWARWFFRNPAGAPAKPSSSTRSACSSGMPATARPAFSRSSAASPSAIVSICARPRRRRCMFLQMLARKGLVGMTLPGDGRPSDRPRKKD